MAIEGLNKEQFNKFFDLNDAMKLAKRNAILTAERCIKEFFERNFLEGKKEVKLSKTAQKFECRFADTTFNAPIIAIGLDEYGVYAVDEERAIIRKFTYEDWLALMLCLFDDFDITK